MEVYNISTTVQNLQSLVHSKLKFNACGAWSLVAACVLRFWKGKYFYLNFFLKNGDYIVYDLP